MKYVFGWLAYVLAPLLLFLLPGRTIKSRFIKIYQIVHHGIVLFIPRCYLLEENRDTGGTVSGRTLKSCLKAL